MKAVVARPSQQRRSQLGALLLRLGGVAGALIGVLWALPGLKRASVPSCRRPADCVTGVFETVLLPALGLMLLGCALGLLLGALVSRLLREPRSR